MYSFIHIAKTGDNIMPSKTKKQAKLMAAAAHDPAFAKKVGVPQKVAEEFNHADERTGILKGKHPARKSQSKRSQAGKEPKK